MAELMSEDDPHLVAIELAHERVPEDDSAGGAEPGRGGVRLSQESTFWIRTGIGGKALLLGELVRVADDARGASSVPGSGTAI